KQLVIADTLSRVQLNDKIFNDDNVYETPTDLCLFATASPTRWEELAKFTKDDPELDDHVERLTKYAKKLQDVFKRRQQESLSNLDNLFHIAHADAIQLMKIEEDRMFLQHQRGPGRPGQLGGVDKKLTDKEERARLRAVKEENRRIKYVSALTS
ncbi:hypothetical protein AVEN_104557-1, partial [Araneus ventricosus]